MAQPRDSRRLRRRSEDRAAIMSLPAPWVGPTLTVVTIWTTGTRAWDYLRLPQHAESLAYLRVFGITEWGAAFAAVGVLLLAGLLVSMRPAYRIGPLLLAHCVALGVYGAFLIALVQGAVHAGLNGQAFETRAIGFAATDAALHFIRAATTARAAAARGARL